MLFYVYILKMANNQHYIGMTKNIERRFVEHKKGKVKSTKHKLPVKLILTEKFKTKTEALKREKQIKSYKGGNAFRKLIICHGARVV
jgi:putative endonuclease